MKIVDELRIYTSKVWNNI